jgi:hypothetical protein
MGFLTVHRQTDVTAFFRLMNKLCRPLGLVDRNNPITEMVAKKIWEIGQASVLDPAKLSKRAIKKLGTHRA